MKAYYFAESSRKLRYGDNRAIVVGESHSVDGPIIPCESGLHASVDLSDALRYAPGNILYIVELDGVIVEHRDGDKHAASTRTYLAEFDATTVLQAYARRVALDVFPGTEYLYRSPEEAAIVRLWLEIGVGDSGIVRSAANAAAAAATPAYAAAYAANAAAYAAAYAANAAAYAAAAAATPAYAAAYAAYAAATPAYAAREAAKKKYAEWLEEMIAESTGWEV